MIRLGRFVFQTHKQVLDMQRVGRDTSPRVDARLPNEPIVVIMSCLRNERKILVDTNTQGSNLVMGVFRAFLLCCGGIGKIAPNRHPNRQTKGSYYNTMHMGLYITYQYRVTFKPVLWFLVRQVEHLLMCFTQVGSLLGVEPYGGGGDGDGGVGLLDNPGGPKRVLFVRIVVVRPLVVGMLRHATRYRK